MIPSFAAAWPNINNLEKENEIKRIGGSIMMLLMMV